MPIIPKMIKLPHHVKAITVKNSDDTYTIFLNSLLDFETLRQSYMHELLHIHNDDFNYWNINEIELINHMTL